MGYENDTMKELIVDIWVTKSKEIKSKFEEYGLQT